MSTYGSDEENSSTPEIHKIVKRYASKSHVSDPKNHVIQHKDTKKVEKKKKRPSQHSLHHHEKGRHLGNEESNKLAKKVEELEKLVAKVRKDVAVQLESMKNSISVLRNQVYKQ